MGHRHQSLVVLDPDGIQLLNNSHTTIIKGLSVLVWDFLSSIMQFPWCKQKIMLDNLIEAAEVITFRTETQTKKGRKYDKKVAITLWPQGEESMQTPHTHSLNMKMIMKMMQGCPTQCRLMTWCRTWLADHARWGYIGIAFPVNDQCLTQTKQDYILQFVDCINSFLDALLSQEDFPNEDSTCSHCSGRQWAVWRCQDCSIELSELVTNSLTNLLRYTQFQWILQNCLYLPQFWAKKYVFGLVWNLVGRAIITKPVVHQVYPNAKL